MKDTEIPKDKNIKLISMHDEMSSSYLSYAMSVIVSRALPDVRDGLKPVHRRILFAMYKGGYDWSKQFRKSARIVGDVIGKYQSENGFKPILFDKVDDKLHIDINKINKPKISPTTTIVTPEL